VIDNVFLNIIYSSWFICIWSLLWWLLFFIKFVVLFQTCLGIVECCWGWWMLLCISVCFPCKQLSGGRNPELQLIHVIILFLDQMLWCGLSLESSQRFDSNEGLRHRVWLFYTAKKVKIFNILIFRG